MIENASDCGNGKVKVVGNINTLENVDDRGGDGFGTSVSQFNLVNLGSCRR